MEYKDYEKAITTLRSARKYVQQVHDETGVEFDDFEGDNYDDGALYYTMKEIQKLLSEIDELVAQFDEGE